MTILPIANRRSLALKYSEAKYRTIIETTQEGVWVLDKTDHTSFVNQQMAKMLGYSVTDMLGMSFLDLIDTEGSSMAEIYLNQRHQGIMGQHRAKLCHRDGKVVWALVSATPLFDDMGQYDGCIKLVTDITHMVEIQEALQTSEAQLASVLNSSLDGIMAFRSLRDETGEIVDFIWLLTNPTAGKLVGRSPQKLIGKQLLEEMPGNKTDGLFDAYVQVVESGEPFQYEFHYQHDGIDCWFENVAVKLGDGFAVTFRDVTRTKQSEKALQQVNQELEQRLDDLKQRHQEMVILGEINEFLQACNNVDEAYEAIARPVAPYSSLSVRVVCLEPVVPTTGLKMWLGGGLIYIQQLILTLSIVGDCAGVVPMK
ncbi:MAG: PAS domain S-box protein [Limnospira maxima]|uniref:PAS domain-containing protein n=1 Tax=Limnospira sp. Paracas R14 TaxID=2981108 RepID=UPI0028E25982